MIKIAPSILASDFSRLGDEIKRVEIAGADLIHVDVMDGHFVPNITIGPGVVESIRGITGLDFDVHLMIEKPEIYIDKFIDAGADIITVHSEACSHLHRTVYYIKEKGKIAGVSLNPATPLCVLESIIADIDMVLLMTVNPGFGGQSYIKSMTSKIESLKDMIAARNLKVEIEVDGGIDEDNIYEVTKAGAGIIVAGTTVFKASDINEIIRILRAKAYSQGIT